MTHKAKECKGNHRILFNHIIIMILINYYNHKNKKMFFFNSVLGHISSLFFYFLPFSFLFLFLFSIFLLVLFSFLKQFFKVIWFYFVDLTLFISDSLMEDLFFCLVNVNVAIIQSTMPSQLASSANLLNAFFISKWATFST